MSGKSSPQLLMHFFNCLENERESRLNVSVIRGRRFFLNAQLIRVCHHHTILTMFASNEPQKQVINHFVDWQPHSARMKPL
jgi:hypothetical protein